MNNTIANEEFAYLFEENSFTTKNGKINKNAKKTAEHLELEALYNQFEARVPERGSISPSVYVGHRGDQYLFEVAGYKDYVRVDDKPNEARYLRNIGYKCFDYSKQITDGCYGSCPVSPPIL